MKLLTLETNYNETIEIAKNLPINNDIKLNKNITYHCFWSGTLSEKHLYSIKSCFFFNIYRNHHLKNKIIFWTFPNIEKNNIYYEIKKYAEIKFFDLMNEMKETFLSNKTFNVNPNLSFYSDTIRYVLLYKYGGVWFDLDIMFLRSFHPLIEHFGQEICVYQWENEMYPNGAIFISLLPYDERMKTIITFIVDRNCGWGFQESMMHFNLDLPFLVLPCSWFDPNWVKNDYQMEWNDFFKTTERTCNFHVFFKGSFCYHWHNRWDHEIEKHSYFQQLCTYIDKNLV